VVSRVILAIQELAVTLVIVAHKETLEQVVIRVTPETLEQVVIRVILETPGQVVIRVILETPGQVVIRVILETPGHGTSGYSGYSGDTGTSGYSGYSGDTGTSGYSGVGVQYWTRDAGNGEIYPTTITDEVGIGTANPECLLQIGLDHANQIIGNTPIAKIWGSANTDSSETILRFGRIGNDGVYYPAVVDFNVYSFDPSGAPTYGPGTQLDISLKAVNSWTETAEVVVMSLRDSGDVIIGSDGGGNTSIKMNSSAAGDYLEFLSESNRAIIMSYGASNELQLGCNDSYVRIFSAPTTGMYFDCGGIFYWRDMDDSAATRMTLDSATGSLDINGTLDIGSVVENKSAYNYMVIDGTRVKYNAGCPFIYTLKNGEYVVNNLAFHQMIPGDMSEQFSEINADKCDDYTKMKIVAKHDEIAYIDYFAIMVRYTVGTLTKHIEYPCTHDIMKARNEEYFTMKQGDEIEINFANLNLPVAEDIDVGIIVKGYTKALNIVPLKCIEEQEKLESENKGVKQ